MNRRSFLQLTALPWWGLWACQSKANKASSLHFPIHLLDDSSRGHQLMKNKSAKTPQEIQKDCLIVGGGIAGLTAASILKDKNIWLCELSDRLGGSSAYFTHQGYTLCQGAHYELDYPRIFGQEATTWLEKQGILRWDKVADHWKFRAQEYYIKDEQLEQCYQAGSYRGDVLPDVAEKEYFLDLMRSYEGKVALPSASIPEPLRVFNLISFQTFLKQKGIRDPRLWQGIDHHMRDDYGANASEVSALAGIVYYACRPYTSDSLETFSPPQGNAYFVEQLSKTLSPDQVRKGHLVKAIRREGKAFRVEIEQLDTGKVYALKVPKIIFAAQKHTLKYIFPECFPYFQSLRYAPWVVQNFIMKASPDRDIYWQNEVLSSDKAFLGFINSRSQASPPGSPPVLTAYYCFPDQERKYLLDLPGQKQAFTGRSLQHIAQYWEMDVAELSSMVDTSYLKSFGHGMPIPGPGYLFRDANLHYDMPNFAFAGTDNGRLPLFLEAVDSGIQAVKHVYPEQGNLL